jgi:hypothetical protein
MQIGLLGRWSKRWPRLASRSGGGKARGEAATATATRQSNGFASALAGGADVTLAPGAEENGLAIMLGDLVRQNLEAKPKKMVDFDALEGRVSIVADDADVALTLVFERRAAGSLTIHDGIVGIPDVTIRGPSEAVLALSNMPLATRFGLPLPTPGDPEAVKTVRDLMRSMREGKLHFYGMLLHLPLVMRLTRVMSVNG